MACARVLTSGGHHGLDPGDERRIGNGAAEPDARNSEEFGQGKKHDHIWRTPLCQAVHPGHKIGKGLVDDNSSRRMSPGQSSQVSGIPEEPRGIVRLSGKKQISVSEEPVNLFGIRTEIPFLRQRDPLHRQSCQLRGMGIVNMAGTETTARRAVRTRGSRWRISVEPLPAMVSSVFTP